MYELFCNVNVLLMWGHPVDADRIFWLYVPPKVDNKQKHGKNHNNIFCLHDGGGQDVKTRAV